MSSDFNGNEYTLHFLSPQNSFLRDCWWWCRETKKVWRQKNVSRKRGNTHFVLLFFFCLSVSDKGATKKVNMHEHLFLFLNGIYLGHESTWKRAKKRERKSIIAHDISEEKKMRMRFFWWCTILCWNEMESGDERFPFFFLKSFCWFFFGIIFLLPQALMTSSFWMRASKIAIPRAIPTAQ